MAEAVAIKTGAAPPQPLWTTPAAGEPNLMKCQR
jgi:hypothetical protein